MKGGKIEEEEAKATRDSIPRASPHHPSTAATFLTKSQFRKCQTAANSKKDTKRVNQSPSRQVVSV